MVSKTTLILCFLFLLGTLCVEGQRDGRRRSGRRKPTTESPPPAVEPESEKNPQKLDTEPEAIAKPPNTQPIESETKSPLSEKESSSANQGGPPFIVPRGTRKPRPHVRNNGESRPRPTLPSFSRKRGPKPERQQFRKNNENSLISSSTTTTTTTSKPSRTSSRNRNSNSQERNSTAEKATHINDETENTTEATAKKRFGGGTRRPSRGNRRYNAAQDQS